ncbi:unnamed protein product [Nippostrongylus brasiliensis]|uniref:GAR domain-containing protein n=1 Tax=Nippostrongylus brasiliensis TaxID=27835 RepID=A0A0N4Y257_NIPBR|nr:unnamed protein product [Nippostrongylus brasiliensis]
MEPVSIDHQKLTAQRADLYALAEKHKDGLDLLDELESVSAKLSEAERETCGNRLSATPRIAMELVAKYNAQAEAMKSRSERINAADQKAIELQTAEDDLSSWISAQHKNLLEQDVPTTIDAVNAVLSSLERLSKAKRQEQRRLDEIRLRGREIAADARLPGEGQLVTDRHRALSEHWDQLTDLMEATRDRAALAEKWIDGYAAMDKWLSAKRRMLLAIGPPTTDAAIARTQLGQLQLIGAEMVAEEDSFKKLNDMAKSLTDGGSPDAALAPLMDQMNSQWTAFGKELSEKERNVQRASDLGSEIKSMQKSVMNDLAVLDSSIEKLEALLPSEVEAHLGEVSALKGQLEELNNHVDHIAQLVSPSSGVEIDSINQSDLEDQMNSLKKRMEEMGRKLDQLKSVAMSSRHEGDEIDKKLEALLDVIRGARSEIEEAPPLTAEMSRLQERADSVDALLQKTSSLEADFPFVRAMVTERLKKVPDEDLQMKLQYLTSSWNPTISTIKDRKTMIAKVMDLVKQYADLENSLRDGLKQDEEENRGIGGDCVFGLYYDLRRLATYQDSVFIFSDKSIANLPDPGGTEGLAARINSSAPGPEANKFVRSAENFTNDCGAFGKKIAVAIENTQRKADLAEKFGRLVDEARHVVDSQTQALEAGSADLASLERVVAPKAQAVTDTLTALNDDFAALNGRLQELETTLTKAQAVTDTLTALNDDFAALNDRLQELETTLSAKRQEGEKLTSESAIIKNQANVLFMEVTDLDPVARGIEELSAQKKEIKAIEEQLNSSEQQLNSSIAEWDKGLADGVVNQSQWESNRAHADDVKKLIEKSRKKLAQREKKVEQAIEEVQAVQKNAAELVAELNALCASDALNGTVTVSDPGNQAEKLKGLKDGLKAIGARVDDFVAECKLLIRTGGPESDTTELDSTLKKVCDTWSAVSTAIAEKERETDAAVQQLGRYEDAYKSLLNWIEETEEMMENQRPPAADSKVAKAQLHAYDVLMKHIEDKDFSVKGFSSLIAKLVAMATVEDEIKSLKQRDEEISQRYNQLVAAAHDRLQRLIDAVDLAERLSEGVTPLETWLGKAEKRLNALGKVPTDVEKMEQQLTEQKDLEEEVYQKAEEVERALAVVPMLSALVNVEDANSLEAQANQITGRYEYGDIMLVADEKLALLAKAIPLSERFHEGFDAVMLWVEAVEDDLLQIDSADLATQTQLVFSMEEAMTHWRPEVDDLVAISSQLQALSSQEQAEELFQSTTEMNRRVNQIADKVARRAERLDVADRQSRAVFDELSYLLEWLGDARDRVVAAGPPSIDPDFARTQLRNQLSMNDDVTANKARLREKTIEAKKVCRELGNEGMLERALALSLHLTAEFDRLADWLDQVDDQLRNAPELTTATPSHQLWKQKEHNSQFKGDVKALQEICVPEDGVKLGELADEIIAKYDDVRKAVELRGQALDSIVDATSGLGERLDNFVQSLQGASDRMRQNTSISSNPALLQTQIAENQAIKEGLRSKQAAYGALKESAAELLSSLPQGDPARVDVDEKLRRLADLWKSIEQEADERGGFLESTLAKAQLQPAAGQPEELQRQQVEMQTVAGSMTNTENRLLGLREAGAALSGIIPVEEQTVINAQVNAVQGEWNTITKLFADKNRDLVVAMEDAMAFHMDLSSLMAWLDEAEVRLSHLPPAESVKVDEIPTVLEEVLAFKEEMDRQAVLKEQLCYTAGQIASGTSVHQAAAIRQPISKLNLRWTQLYSALCDRENKVERMLLQMGRLSEAIEQMVAWIRKTRATLNELSVTAPGLRQLEIQRCQLTVVANDVAEPLGIKICLVTSVELLCLIALMLFDHFLQERSHFHSYSHSAGNLKNIVVTVLHDTLKPFMGVSTVWPRRHVDSIVSTLNAAAQRLLRDDRNTDVLEKMNEMNTEWQELNRILDDLKIHMERAKDDAEKVGREAEKWMEWLEDVESQLATTKPTGGLPETAEVQLDDFRVLRSEIAQNKPLLEAYINESENSMEKGDNSNQSWISRNHALIKTKWAKVKELCADREKKLELALEEAVALDTSMRDTADWLMSAEQRLAEAKPVSRLADVLQKQVVENEKWVDEVAVRKQMMAEQQAAGTRLQYYCEKKDAIPIKNGLVSLKHRFEKVASRTADRTKSLKYWLDEVESRIPDEQLSTSNVNKLKEHHSEVKKIQAELASRQQDFEMTYKRGKTLIDHAPRSEVKQIAEVNDGFKKRWNSVLENANQKRVVIEQALVESSAFEDAVLELESWIDAELEKNLTAGNRVLGDLDTVKGLAEEHRKREAAEQLSTKDAGESGNLATVCGRVKEKWLLLEEQSRVRTAAIEEATTRAASFDAKVHEILDWLVGIEGKLAVSSSDLKLALTRVEEIKVELRDSRGLRDACLEDGKDLYSKCHPRAEQPLKHWLRVVENRWKEVEEKALEREFSLLDQEQQEKEREEALAELLEFVAKKREELNKMLSQTLPQDLETMTKAQRHHEDFDFELREKQADVDGAVKMNKKGKSSVAATKLADEWKQLWLDSIGHQAALETQRQLLDEMRRLEGWRWEQWKEQYVEWNDHRKARVSDLFRRIDRSHTGNIPRDVFIEAVLASKFPSSRLEMNKVADLFDKGDGLINSKEFIDALRFDRSRELKPMTDHEKVNEEITKQKNACSCCQQFKIEKVADGHYRFGDTQIKRMVRILRSTVMVRVGGGWEALEEFLSKHDPCRAKGRLNIDMFYKDVTPSTAIDTMRAFTKGRYRSGGNTNVTLGPVMKVREKTERSLPMFPQRRDDGDIGEHFF